jgi:hypothetical protein
MDTDSSEKRAAFSFRVVVQVEQLVWLCSQVVVKVITELTIRIQVVHWKLCVLRGTQSSFVGGGKWSSMKGWACPVF